MHRYKAHRPHPTNDLNNLVTNGAGYDLESIRAFNDAGDIIATAATPSDGGYAAVLLTPTTGQLTPSAVPLPRAAWAALTALPLSLLSRRVRRGLAIC